MKIDMSRPVRTHRDRTNLEAYVEQPLGTLSA